VDKVGFELKAGYNAFETGGQDGKLLRIEEGQTYVTSDPFEIGVLRSADAVKEVAAPEGARSRSKVDKEG